MLTTPLLCSKPIRMQPSFELKSMQQSAKAQIFSSVVLYATGELIVAADGNMLRVSFLQCCSSTPLVYDNAPAQMMSVTNPSQESQMPMDGIITAMCLSEPMLFVAIHAAVPGKTKHPAGIIMMFDLSTGSRTPTPLLTQSGTYSHKGAVTQLAMGTVQGAPVLASASTDGALHVWAKGAQGGWTHTPLEGHTLSIRGVAWMPNGLVTVAEDELIHVWSPGSSQAPVLTLTPDLHQHGGPLTACDASGSVVFTAAQNGSINSWDLSDLANPKPFGLQIAARPSKPVEITCIKVLQLASAGGMPLLAVGSGNGMIVLKDTTNGLQDLAGAGRGQHGSGGHFKPVLSIIPVIMPGPTDFFVSAGQDGQMFVWNFLPSLNA